MTTGCITRAVEREREEGRGGGRAGWEWGIRRQRPGILETQKNGEGTQHLLDTILLSMAVALYYLRARRTRE